MKENKIIITNEQNQIRTYQSVGSQIQICENIVLFGRKEENGVNQYYRAYYMLENPLKGTNKIIVKAMLKIKIIDYPSALLYSVHTVKSDIVANQLPVVSNTPIIDNAYPNNLIQSIDITNAMLDKDFKGIVIKATSETLEATGCAKMGGSTYEESPILEIYYYEKDKQIKEENSKNYALNEKGTLSVNLMHSAKHFYHSDLKIGNVHLQHMNFDEDISWGKNKDNQAITP